jgi:hypothetical protein
MATSLAVSALLAKVSAVSAVCPSGFECKPEQVAVQTAANGCNTINGGTLQFQSFPPYGGSQTLRACYCATDAHFSGIDSTGVEFLASAIGGTNTEDFTIVDSGVVGNGPTTKVSGAAGCKGVTFTNFSGCPGNPSQYCYADITFSPVEVGTPLSANITFLTECPNLLESLAQGSGTPPSCIEYLPLGSDPTFNYDGVAVALKGGGTGLSIVQPANGIPIPMSTPASTTDPGSVSISFQTQVPSADESATIQWSDMLEYRTSGNKPVATLKDSFQTTGNNPIVRNSASKNSANQAIYTGAGGFWTITATLQSDAECRSVPVTGFQVPLTKNNSLACTIASGLKSLYTFAPSGSTSTTLLELLAWTESSYQQFAQLALDQPKSRCSLIGPVSGLWPNENSAGGTSIGLMMVDLTEASAWNWVANAKAGAKTFQAKLAIALKHSNNQHARKDLTPQLPPMNATQLEDQALAYYKGWKAFYEVPQCSSNISQTKGQCVNGTWRWVENPNPCQGYLPSKCSDDDSVDTEVDEVRDATPTCLE